MSSWKLLGKSSFICYILLLVRGLGYDVGLESLVHLFNEQLYAFVDEFDEN